jgi:hypothetical protein
MDRRERDIAKDLQIFGWALVSLSLLDRGLAALPPPTYPRARRKRDHDQTRV